MWPKLLGYQHMGVIDGAAMSHTRPVGQMRDTDLRRRTLEESDRLQERYDCAQVHTTFSAFGEDLQPIDLTPEQLLVEFVGRLAIPDRNVTRGCCRGSSTSTASTSPRRVPVEGTP